MTPERFARLRAALNRRQPDLTVVLEQVHKPHNLSAVLRTCDAVGVLGAHAVVPEGAIRASQAIAMGSAKWVDLHVHRSLDDAFTTLREQGLTVWAAHLGPGAVDYREVSYTAPTAVLFGQERHGVSPAALARVDGFLAIPMAGLVASLNVSVAAALVLFEARRQREAAGGYDGTPRLAPAAYTRRLFEWCYPLLAELYRQRGEPYPELGPDGSLPASALTQEVDP